MKEHFKILDLLRGLAALGVVLFHFNLPTLYPNSMSEVSSYGQYGVQVFFVISGFIIPYSMFKNKYTISDYFRYLLRRYIRIDPPSYFAILITFGLYFSAIIIMNRPIRGMVWPGINFRSIIGNLTYTVPYLKTSWFNPVFWTLAIEFQFYILIGLLLPVILKKNNLLTSTLLVVILMLGHIDFLWFFRQGSFFILGIILFMRREKLINDKLIIILTVLTLGFCLYQNNVAEFIFAFAAFLVIASGTNIQFRFTTFLGKISYSLYITHHFVGFSSEIILKRLIPIHHYFIGRTIMYFVYVGIAIGFAFLFYKYIETPFLHYSKRVKLSKTSKPISVGFEKIKYGIANSI